MEIKRHLSIIVSVLFGAMFLNACKKDNLDSRSTTLPVIESYLMVGQPISVKLYLQKNLTDTATYGSPITGQTLYLSDGPQKYHLTETAKGTYTYADQSILTTGKKYTLQFDYNGYTVSATTTMPAKPQNFASQYAGITISGDSGPGSQEAVLNVFTWSNPDSLNHVLAFEGTGTMIQVNRFATGRPINVQLNTNRASQYNITARTLSYLGNYQAILFSVNQEYINLMSTSTRTTSQSLTQVPTNIVNGFGIFTAMQADTLSFATH